MTTSRQDAAVDADPDYEALGLVAGLEIHQQLDTETKLFCDCPTEACDPEAATKRFVRYLHPTRSELGEMDEAALEESRIRRQFEYLVYDSTCLVEADEEPPHRVDAEAMGTALQVAALLDMDPVDQVHVMRKIVIDGSNTSGFQRTMQVAADGAIETDAGEVRIADLMLEEESARRIEAGETGVTYGLDRLGVPLVEIGTEPDIATPEGARAAAERIGMLLRSTGKVKRGLGTIRQDVNVSVERGARVEIKGVQSLDDIDDIVRVEADRQVALADLAAELQARDAAVGAPTDVTAVFDATESDVIRGALDDDGAVRAVRLEGFDGLVGREVAPDRRLGTELSDHATRHGAGGIFHTDELPGYGITDEEVTALRTAVDAGADDAVALVAAAETVADAALEAVADRARAAVEGVPKETRGANEDGATRYLRPLPGAARMYPETDVPPVDPDTGDVTTPELLTERADRYADEHGLDPDLAEQVAYGERMPLYEAAVEHGVEPTTAADVLESTLTELRRDGVAVDRLANDHLLGTFDLLADGALPAEGVPTLLTALAENPDLTAEAAAELEDLGGVDESEVREAVARVLERNAAQVEQEGMGAFSALMGEAMGELRGKADGEVVSDALRAAIRERT